MAAGLTDRVSAGVRPVVERLLQVRPPEQFVTLEGIRANAVNLQVLMGDYRSQCTERVIQLVEAGGSQLAGLLFETPDTAASNTLLVYVHGGGWVYGGTDFVADTAAYMALAAKSPVLSISYRLAPEHRSPAAEEDVVLQLRGIAENLSELAPGCDRVVVVGDSAGGYLALRAMLSIEPQLRRAIEGLVLVYPVTDPPHTHDSYASNADGITLTANRMELFWNFYQPNPAARASAVDAATENSPLSSLPPTTVLTAELDPLRDEGTALARRLGEAGVLHQTINLSGQVHGLMWMRGVTDEAELIFNAIATHVRDE